MSMVTNKAVSRIFSLMLLFFAFTLTGCKEGTDGFFQKEGSYVGGSGGGLKDDGSDSSVAPTPPDDDDKSDDGSKDDDSNDSDDDDSNSDSDKDEDKDEDRDDDGGGCSKDKDKNKEPCPEKISKDKILDGSVKWQDIACDHHKVAVCHKTEGKSHHGAFRLQIVDHHALSGHLKDHKESFLLDCKDVKLINAVTNNFKRHEDCNCK